jgi:hypothetical protein
MSKQYWASQTPQETVQECISRSSDYYGYISERGIRFVWMLVYLFKHSATERQVLSTSTGEQSELSLVRINDFRTKLQQKVGIVKNQRATWEPMAVNDDVTSLAQTKVAKSILEMYTSHKGYDHKFNELVKFAVDYGESFALQLWDATKGKITRTLPLYDKSGNAATSADGNQKVFNEHEGDVDCRIYEPINVIRDCYITNQDQNKWFIFRDRVNKWDLAAKHPDLYDEIVNKTLEVEDGEYYTEISPYMKSADLVTMYTFVHQKTAALPNGRIIQYLDDNIILSSSELNYDDVPYHRLVDQPITGSNFSYTESFDLLQVQDLADGLWSTIITNQRAFGVQNIIMPKGSDISETQLFGNLNLITYDPASGGKPESLNLLQTPREIFESLSLMEQMKGTISGVSSVAQGQLPNDVSSGVAISMLQSLNVQYNQGLQGSYIEVMTSVGTALLNILKTNAKTERLVEFTGSSSRSLLQKFTGKDISSISRVEAKPGNPLSQTIQGRFTIAQMLAQMGLVHDTQELLEVLETGNLDVLDEGSEMELIYLQQENEELQNGNNVPVLLLDDHVTHIRKHIGILSDLNLRSGKDPKAQQIIQTVQQHIMDHFKFLGDPNVSQMLSVLGYQAGQPPQGAGPGGPPRAAQGPGGTVNINNKLGPSPANGAKLPPQAANQQPTTVAQAAGNLEAPVGTVPTTAIQAAHKASKPPGGPHKR